MLGVSGCTTCLIASENMGNPMCTAPLRSFARARLVVANARDCASARVRGGITKARLMLRAEGLLENHLTLDNPFLQVPNLDFSCFPMDRLHGVYVLVCCACARRTDVFF